MAKENVAQELAENMLTDPDRDADGTPPPSPPQTVDAEPSDGHDVPVR